MLHGGFRPGGSAPEWCDAEVLRILRRRSLANLRREVEPVDTGAYARFLVSWHGANAGSRNQRVADVLDRLQGCPIPVSVLERDVLPARIPSYVPRMLDEVCASGEYAWVGCGALGASDGRIALYRREQLLDLAPAPGFESARGETHQAIIQALQQGGALFFTDLVAFSRATWKEALDATWDLVWAGIVTNDTLGPLRALSLPKTSRTPRRGRSSLPPEAAGRWSLSPLARGFELPPATARAHALAEALLERYGVVTREAVVSEGIEGGFAAVYPVLKAMEESGHVRRGYFIEGLGGAQFAQPGAVDRLRGERDAPDEPAAVVLAATDPANLMAPASPGPAATKTTAVPSSAPQALTSSWSTASRPSTWNAEARASPPSHPRTTRTPPVLPSKRSRASPRAALATRSLSSASTANPRPGPRSPHCSPKPASATAIVALSSAHLGGWLLMPEGDSVYRFAARLRGALEGQVIRDARAKGPGAVPRVEKLVGATCTGLDTRGKNLFIHFDNGLSLRGHLRMHGTWHVYAPGASWRRSPLQARLVLETDTAVVVNFSAPVIELLETRAIAHHRPVAAVGPDLLAPDFDESVVLAGFRDPLLAGQTIGDAIMDQRVMAGVGNIWKHETLFREGINPWRHIRDLSDEQLLAVIRRARSLLRMSIGEEDARTRTGRPTYFVYGKSGQPCRRCGARIRSAPQGNDVRYTAWCPRCQPEQPGDAIPARNATGAKQR
ncbi:MAG: DNA-formamidopyrimidine glycosylase family protein [Dehalococcoidia bacterium]|nr:DNA-formamidopyrimidine glycosylase family protein [Dehalococcoidia bacterium]